MKVTLSEISQFITLTSTASYNEQKKEYYKKLGRKILKYIAEQLQLKEGEYQIRWNPGGIAVSGDHILHTKKFYLAFHDNLGSGWFYYRTVRGLDDYTGGRNLIVHWKEISKGLPKLIKALKVLQDGGYKEENGDFNMNPTMVERYSLQQLR